jgi:hypothetical protein
MKLTRADLGHPGFWCAVVVIVNAVAWMWVALVGI